MYLQHLYLLRKLKNLRHKENLEIEGNVLNLFQGVLNLDRRDDNVSPSIRKQAMLVARVKRCINCDLSRNIGLVEIAEQAYSSPFHISRIFKENTGIGINQYRNQQRLRLVSLKLLHGFKDLTILANDFGYSSYTHSSYYYKKYYGNTPSQFRHGIN